jgi:hypothetical protein
MRFGRPLERHRHLPKGCVAILSVTDDLDTPPLRRDHCDALNSGRARRVRRTTKRQRRRAREAQHDLRAQYRESDLPFQNGVGVLVTEDPYSSAGNIDGEGNLNVRAQLRQARHADGTLAEGAPGWTPPQKPLVTVITALRDDALGRMYARRQIDRPQIWPDALIRNAPIARRSATSSLST